jgi:hypothetical protein
LNQLVSQLWQKTLLSPWLQLKNLLSNDEDQFALHLQENPSDTMNNNRTHSEQEFQKEEEKEKEKEEKKKKTTRFFAVRIFCF